jgi:tetratricopeptide (TPR) repeat protein
LLAVVLGVVALLAAGWLWMSRGKSARKENPLLVTPSIALEGLQSKSLYFNGAAWPWLKLKRPDLLKPEESEPNSERVRDFSQAVQNPKLFRQLDRQDRFDTLLLVGDPTQYRMLLEHLLETQDWGVSYVDHIAVVFKRGGAEKWSLARLEPVRQRFAHASREDRAIFLAKTASKLIALREPAAARQLLGEADALGSAVPDVESTRAQYHLSRGEWKEALAAAERALKIDGTDLSALGTKAQALYSTKRFAEAYNISKQLVAKLPDEPNILFYHARIAHEAKAFQEEAKVLRRLIVMAEADHRPTAGYRVYLGQSLASAGEASPALAEFQAALADPDLPKEQREFAMECMEVIRQQVRR